MAKLADIFIIADQLNAFKPRALFELVKDWAFQYDLGELKSAHQRGWTGIQIWEVYLKKGDLDRTRTFILVNNPPVDEHPE